MNLNAIVAVSDNNCIGVDGKIPWHIPDDLKWFKQCTMGGTVIMGRKTFESLSKPLPGRKNVVITRDPTYTPPGVLTTTNLEGLHPRWFDTQPWIIGGGEIYSALLSKCEYLYLTRVHKHIEGDTFLSPSLYDQFETEQLLRSEPEFTVYRLRNTAFNF